MTEDAEDIESDEDIEPDPDESLSYTKSSRKVYSKLATNLTDDELNSPGVQKMLLAEISRLESTVSYSDRFKEKFHKADKDRAILEEKEKKFVFTEVLYSGCLTIGSLIIGLTPSIKSDVFPPIILGVIGAILVLTAFIAKVVKK